MPIKPLSFHPEAIVELDASIDWYQERSAAAAARFAAEIERATGRISSTPHRWPCDERGIRKYVLNHFPYAVVYYETDTSIQILAVAHGRRRPDFWHRRLR